MNTIASYFQRNSSASFDSIIPDEAGHGRATFPVGGQEGVLPLTLHSILVIDKCHAVIRIVAGSWFDVHGSSKPNALDRPFQQFVPTLVQKLP